MDKEIFIVRHGRTEFNRLGIWQGSSVDAPLDDEGIRQADKFYSAYRTHAFELIIHSALKRSKQTVSQFLELGIPFLEDKDINEISWGFHEGKPHTDESLAQYKSVIESWRKEKYERKFEGGESALDLSKRIGRFVNNLSKRTEQKILICSHGRAMRALICMMKEEPLYEMEKYKHHNTGVFKAIYRNGNFIFNTMNDTSHLVDKK